MLKIFDLKSNNKAESIWDHGGNHFLSVLSAWPIRTSILVGSGFFPNTLYLSSQNITFGHLQHVSYQVWAFYSIFQLESVNLIMWFPSKTSKC